MIKHRTDFDTRKLTLIDTLFTWFEKYRTPFPRHNPTKPPDTLFGFLGHYARPFWSLIVAASLLSAMVALIEVYLFSFVGSLVDWLSATERDTFWESHKFQVIGISLIILVVIPLLKLFYEAIIHQGLLGNFAMRTRWQTHRYLLKQSVRFFQDDFAGRVAAKMMQTSLGVRDVIISITEVMVYVCVYFVGALILFAASDVRLTLPMIAWLAGYIVVLWYFIPKLRQASMDQAEARSMVTGRVVDSYTNITTVKMFAHANYEDEYAREGMQKFLVPVYGMMRLSARLSVYLTMLNCLLLFSVGANSVWLWYQNAVSPGAIAFAIGLVLRLQGMSQWILWEVWNLFENIGVVQDGIETISNEIDIIDHAGAKELKVLEGHIEYRNITFNYGKSDGKRGVIENLCLDIRGGEKIGVVGRSGSGKSTLVSILLRFYELQGGRILIDGQDIGSVTQDSLRANIGMVTQDTSLLHRSVYENIRYGNGYATLDSVIAAARQAKAHEFIPDLEDLQGRRGYQAHVGERGVKLSGGQRQRISIARVILKNAPILILDEATSALDSEVEAAIQESLYHLMKGKTVIAIAHRLSTIAQMDRLVIMDDGKITEQGSHDRLLAKKGLYAELWARQSGGFLAGEEEESESAIPSGRATPPTKHEVNTTA